MTETREKLVVELQLDDSKFQTQLNDLRKQVGEAQSDGPRYKSFEKIAHAIRVILTYAPIRPRGFYDVAMHLFNPEGPDLISYVAREQKNGICEKFTTNDRSVVQFLRDVCERFGVSPSDVPFSENEADYYTDAPE